MKPLIFFLVAVALGAAGNVVPGSERRDWLLDATPFKARVISSADGQEVELNNGLIRRVIRLHPNAATVALDNLSTGEALLRGVKPEAIVEIDGRRYEVGRAQRAAELRLSATGVGGAAASRSGGVSLRGFPTIGQPTERLALETPCATMRPT